MSGDSRPSLPLGYDRIRDVLWQQSQTADHIDTKCAVYWAVATAVIGIGLGIAFIQAADPQKSVVWLWVGAGVAYLATTVIFLAEQLPTRFELANGPEGLREQFWGLSPDEFQYEMSLHIEEAFDENSPRVVRKGRLMVGVIAGTLTEAVLVVWAASINAFSSLAS